MGKSRGLKICEAAREFSERVITIARHLPRSSPSGFRSQLARGARSVSATIVEGVGRGTTKDTLNFYYMARGSLEEVQNDLRMAVNTRLINRATFYSVWNRGVVIGRMLARLIARLER